jgi:hypothetical protein
MSVVVKDIAAVAAKWSQRANAAGPDYTAGVKNPRGDWGTATAAAAPAWEAGVQQAVANKRFVNGVTKAGTAKWSQGAQAKGAARYPQGVSGAAPAYQNGFAPFLQVISGLTLPPRNPAGSPANLQRVQIVADALHAKKISG